MAIALLWLGAAVGGVCLLFKLRGAAAFAMVVTLCGFTALTYRPGVESAVNRVTVTRQATVEADEPPYVGSSTDRIYHLTIADCFDVRQMRNKTYFHSLADAINAGRTPCDRCLSGDMRSPGTQLVSLTQRPLPRTESPNAAPSPTPPSGVSAVECESD